MKLKKFSPAKINFFLHITGKRTDGYHNLQTVFGRLDFGDELLFEWGRTDELITLVGADTLDCQTADNLIVKATQTLTGLYPTKARPLLIQLNKRIPTGAGLGGGSSNAATTLLAINELWGLGLGVQELVAIGAKLGADVPFFVQECTYAIGEGIGEILTPLALPKRKLLLLLPDSHNSTQSFFGNPALKKDSTPLSHVDILKQHDKFLGALLPPFLNAFENIALQNPAISIAYDYLSHLSTTATPRLTGTGSTVFLPIDGIDDDTIKHWQKNAPCPAIIAHTY